MLETLKKPTDKEKAAARTSAATLKEITNASRAKAIVQFEVEGKIVSLPKRILKLVEKALGAVASGKSVVLSSLSNELTTQEAADLLRVSRPHLIKLLDTGKIPHKMAGSHRRILLDDVRKYDKQLRETRRKGLDFLAKEAQEMGLGY
ncbi:excisionase family DNA-binding protein [uncultured Algoriphagus sp.]|uniref:excisionase family DNA-binding protein n=1 Tax=uncultured Algoriphagus sp. TaxID=417365 RepID=UPI0030EE71C2|tara:strand:- start:4667 stop:5110 length:444 start_codon:yes stop_codon:yes gene_type:complete